MAYVNEFTLEELTEKFKNWLDDNRTQDSIEDRIFSLHVRKTENGYNWIGVKISDKTFADRIEVS